MRCRVWGLAAVACLSVGADEPKQTMDADGPQVRGPEILEGEPARGDRWPGKLKSNRSRATSIRPS